MKTTVMVLLFLGLTNLSVAQESLEVFALSTETNVASSSNINRNSEYLQTVKHQDFARKMKSLQSFVANYDITTASVYQTNSTNNYTVDFKDGQNKITATYDANGQLLNCQEKL